MGLKATFDPLTRIITVTSAPVLENGEWVIDFDVKTDLYSDGKEDWVTTEQLRRLKFPVRSVGGDALVGGKALGATFFLESSWKIKPFEANHVLRVNGNMYSEDGTSPYTTTTGSYNIQIIQSVSSLVDSTVQQLEEIEYSTFQNKVTIDVTSSTTGTAYPAGNTEFPVNNITDAVAIAYNRGFHALQVIGNITLGAGDNIDGFIIDGQNAILSNINILTEAVTNNCEFREASITGVLDGGSILRNCAVASLDYVNGFIYSCVLNSGTIKLGSALLFDDPSIPEGYILDGGTQATIMNCSSGVAGTSTPVIDMNGSGCSLVMSNYNGGTHIINKDGDEAISINLSAGQVILDSTVTNGEIAVRGIGKLTDNSTGSTDVQSTGLISAHSISAAVWDTDVNAHSITGSFGEMFQQIETFTLELLKYQSNKMLIDPLAFTMTIYDDDGTTPITTFDLKDENGVASITNILQRIPR